MASIGFVGLGKMGEPMARNLLRAGHRLKVYDLSIGPREKLAAAGAEIAESLPAVATGVDTVITVLPGGDGHAEVFTGPHGLIGAAGRGTLLIDCSTTAVEAARAIAAAAEIAGQAAIDAPISGGVTGATEATLTFMVGGPDASFHRAEPVLAAMGRTVIHTGSSGSGAAAKICNNLIVGITTVAVCEAFALSERIGLAADRLFAVMSQSSAQSWVLDHLCPVPGVVPSAPASRGYRADGTSNMLLKDLHLAQQAALQFGAAIPLGAATAALYALFCVADGGGLDSSAIIKLISGAPISEHA